MHSQEFFQDSELEGIDPMNRLAFLHLNNTNTTTTAPLTSSEGAPATAVATTAFFSEQQCTNCGNSSLKRRSPSSDSEPKPKKKQPMVVQEDDDDRHSPLGFTKIDLPISFPSITTSMNNPPPPSSPPVLRRSFSDDFYGNISGTSPLHSVTGSTDFLINNNPQSPENLSAVKVAATTPSPSPNRGSSSTSLPPRPPLLRRTVSDPIPSASASLVPTLVRSNSGEMGSGFSLPVDSIKDASPNSKRLRRMKDRMKEMNQWLDEVMREGEDDVSEDNNSTPKQDALDTGAEEEVSVERLGECLSVNFKCPCGTGYQILLSGKHCYYKLL